MIILLIKLCNGACQTVRPIVSYNKQVLFHLSHESFQRHTLPCNQNYGFVTYGAEASLCVPVWGRVDTLERFHYRADEYCTCGC